MYSNSQPERVNIPVIVSRQLSSNSADSQIDTGPIRPPCASRSLVIVSWFLIYSNTNYRCKMQFFSKKILEGALSVLFAFIVRPRLVSSYWQNGASGIFIFFLSSHVVFFVLSITVVCLRKKNIVIKINFLYFNFLFFYYFRVYKR
jgi:hypothetical protein